MKREILPNERATLGCGCHWLLATPRKHAWDVMSLQREYTNHFLAVLHQQQPESSQVSVCIYKGKEWWITVQVWNQWNPDCGKLCGINSLASPVSTVWQRGAKWVRGAGRSLEIQESRNHICQLGQTNCKIKRIRWLEKSFKHQVDNW